MRIIKTLQTLRRYSHDWRCQGQSIVFVPTMGALHDGHLSLIKLAKNHGDRVIVSIYVNPAQFAPGEDLAAYPRMEQADLAKLRAMEIDIAYLPDPETIYHPQHITQISMGGVARGLESDFRPTFFNGVALIVTKLFNRVHPDIAIFGEKDYQQLMTIKALIRDLDIPVTIIGAPIMRDDHGLALSSRNQYFDENGLKIARQLNKIMFQYAEKLKHGQNIQDVLAQCGAELMKAGFEKIDYVSLADSQTLELIEGQNSLTSLQIDDARLLIAAHCKGVRLIDNCAIIVR